MMPSSIPGGTGLVNQANEGISTRKRLAIQFAVTC